MDGSISNHLATWFLRLFIETFMSRFYRRSVLFVLLAAGFAAFAAKAEAADRTIVKSFTEGNSANSVGIAEASEDVELIGPQALTSDADGNLFLLDQLNQRIVRFDPKRPKEEPSILVMPRDVQPSDLIVGKDEFLVWDGGIRTLRASRDSQSTRGSDPGETVLEEISSRGTDDLIANSAFAQMGSQPPGSASELLDENTRAVASKRGRQRSRQYVASRGSGSVVADIIPEKADNSVSVEINTKDDNKPVAQIHLRVRDKLGAVEFLEIDNNNRIYILAENIPESSYGAATFVARYAPDGKLEGVYELPLSNTPMTRRFVTISGDGDVYFLRNQPTGVEVVGVGFRPLANVKTIDIRPKTAISDFFSKFSAIAAVRPSNRQQVVEAAFAFEGLQWMVTPQNYGSDPDRSCAGFNRIRRPWYLQGKVGQQVRGVPYCWGCHGSLAQFRARIENGTLAGNVCTRDAPRTDVAGVDCSAFVSATWGLSVHYTTAAIPAIAKPVTNPWDLRPGDALNKPGSHVMLFLRFTPDRRAEVMESSTGGCNGRVCRNIYPLAALLARGYQPVRFRALADDTTVVAQDAYPVEKDAPQKQARKEKRGR